MSEQQRKCQLCSCSVDKYWYCTAEHEIKIACSNIVCPLNFGISRGSSVAYLPTVKDWDILFQDSNFHRTANWLKACGKEPIKIANVLDYGADPLGERDSSEAFKKAIAATEKPQKDLSVQIGCMIEEFEEFLETLRITCPGNASHADTINAGVFWVIHQLHVISGQLKNNTLHINLLSKVDSLDALCDLEVTLNGVAYLAGFNKPAADQAVLDSNDRKLVDGKPVILEGGKIGKPIGWVAPDLSNFI